MESITFLPTYKRWTSSLSFLMTFPENKDNNKNNNNIDNDIDKERNKQQQLDSNSAVSPSAFHRKNIIRKNTILSIRPATRVSYSGYREGRWRPIPIRYQYSRSFLSLPLMSEESSSLGSNSSRNDNKDRNGKLHHDYGVNSKSNANGSNNNSSSGGDDNSKNIILFIGIIGTYL